MKWQEHHTEDKYQSHKLSIAKQLYKNDLIVQIDEWDAAGDIITHGKIIISPNILRKMIQEAENGK